MNLIKLFAREPDRGTGDLVDVRPFAEKEKDFNAEEVHVFGAPAWIEKPQKDWRRFPIFDQVTSLSCVGQTTAKILGVENFAEEGRFVKLSARDIYSRGFVAPNGGMYSHVGLHLAYKHGATVEQLMPSQKVSETGMRINDATVLTDQIALIAKANGYVQILPPTIDKIAEILDKGKAVALSFGIESHSGGVLKLLKTATLRHQSAVVDRTIWKGLRALIVDNSWGEDWGLDGQGVITETEFNRGVYFAGYLQDLSNDWRDGKEEVLKPQHRFTTELKFGTRVGENKSLQEVLRHYGTFPLNVDLTGYYGNITARAVLGFQKKERVASDSELDQLAGRVVGPKTREALNGIYG